MDNTPEAEQGKITMIFSYPEGEERPKEVMLVLKDPEGMTSREALEAIRDFVFMAEEKADSLFQETAGNLLDSVSDGKVMM